MTGRKPKPIEHLKIAGTLRPARHKGRENAPKATGKPRMPAGLTADAKWMWKLIESLSDQGAFAKADTAALWACCDLWSEVSSCLKAGGRRPPRQAGVCSRSRLLRCVV